MSVKTRRIILVFIIFGVLALLIVPMMQEQKVSVISADPAESPYLAYEEARKAGLPILLNFKARW